jgi:hypothetical protein
MNPLDINKAMANLNSLRKNLPLSVSINEKYVVMYHDEIDRLKKLGVGNLDDFMVPEKEIQNQITSHAQAIPEIDQKESLNYSDDRYVEKEIFLSKFDGLINFLQLLFAQVQDRSKEDIGFRTN